MNRELKESIEQMYESAEDISKIPIFEDIQKEEVLFDLENDIRTDLITFVMYLILEDADVSDVKVQFLKDYFEWDISKQVLEKSIQNSEEEIRMLMSQIPVSLHTFLAADNFMRQLFNMKIVDEVSLCPESERLVFLYETVGEEFFTNNPEASETVKNAYESYIQSLHEFVEDNLLEI